MAYIWRGKKVKTKIVVSYIRRLVLEAMTAFNITHILTFKHVFLRVFTRLQKQSVFKIGWILRLQTATTFRDLGFGALGLRSLKKKTN